MSRKVTKLWKCKDGRKVRICDMTDSHLDNAIAMMERMARAVHPLLVAQAYAIASCLQGEMASYYAEQDIDRLEHSEPEELLPPIYDDLISERDRRKTLQTQSK